MMLERLDTQSVGLSAGKATVPDTQEWRQGGRWQLFRAFHLGWSVSCHLRCMDVRSAGIQKVCVSRFLDYWFRVSAVSQYSTLDRIMLYMHSEQAWQPGRTISVADFLTHRKHTSNLQKKVSAERTPYQQGSTSSRPHQHHRHHHSFHNFAFPPFCAC